MLGLRTQGYNGVATILPTLGHAAEKVGRNDAPPFGGASSAGIGSVKHEQTDCSSTATSGDKAQYGRLFGWGTRIRTSINGVRVRCPTVRRSPNSRHTPSTPWRGIRRQARHVARVWRPVKGFAASLPPLCRDGDLRIPDCTGRWRIATLQTVLKREPRRERHEVCCAFP